MNITKANGKAEYAIIEKLKRRSVETDEKIVEAVTNIIKSVREQGDEAVREFTARFDGGVTIIISSTPAIFAGTAFIRTDEG